jgi:DNA-binding response OmpR family regulator
MPVIILTAHGTGPNAMLAIHLGAYDFITKPLDIGQALATVTRAIRQMELQREVELLPVLITWMSAVLWAPVTQKDCWSNKRLHFRGVRLNLGE